MSQVLLENVVKSYGKITVVHGINMEVAENEFVVLVGPSGCAKSTCLRMVAGLETITDGVIKIGGRVVNDVPPKNRDIAMVFQDYALYPHMNVYDNMAFSLKMRKFPKEEIKAKVEEAARILGLTDFLERLPVALSGGQRQRVAMGRAIVRKANVFLFDEPLSNLDAKLRSQMRTELKKIHQQLKTTTIYVTHDQVEAMTLADKIVILKAGYIQQIGSPIEVYEKPANQFVGGFIGNPSMNQMPATVKAKGEKVYLVCGGLKIPVAEPDRLGLKHGDKATVGIRPDAIELSDGHESREGYMTFEAEVIVGELMGGTSQLELVSERQAVVAQIEGHLMPRFGELKDFAVNLEHLHVFDAKTQETIY